MAHSPNRQGRNISAHDEGEQSTVVSDSDVELVLNISPLPGLIIDENNNCVMANDGLCRFLDFDADALISKNLADILVIDEPLRWEYVKLQMASGDRSDGSWEFLQKGGDGVWGDAYWRDLPKGRRLLLIVDATARKLDEIAFVEAEKKRWQSQRIEALGRLAGGIAHDFNNFLAVILLHLDIMNVQLPAESPIRERVNEIKDVASSVAGIVRQLLAFGRKQPLMPSPVILNDAINKFASGFRSLLPKNVELEFKLEAGLGLCFVDENQIVQILMKLAGNAADAMPAGGTLRIATTNVALDKDASKVQPGGSYVQISVADNGIGMDAITEDYIFEPFFTTKESDKGAGLALAMVYGTIKQSKGFIWVESEVGKGTTFKIQFPRIDQTPASPIEGSETVLLVDDEEAVRRITAEFLKMSGYEVLQAGSGMEAIEIAQAYFKTIHLLLTDFTMPMMNGKDAAEKIRRLHPETAVLYMSGNIENVVSSDEGSPDATNFIGKPFSPLTLNHKVRELLQSR